MQSKTGLIIRGDCKVVAMTYGDETWTTSDVGGLTEYDRTHGWGTMVVAAAAPRLAFHTGEHQYSSDARSQGP